VEGKKVGAALRSSEEARVEAARVAREEYEKRRGEKAEKRRADEEAECVLRAGGTHVFGTTPFRNGE
jgi:hypothetical protein